MNRLKRALACEDKDKRLRAVRGLVKRRELFSLIRVLNEGVFPDARNAAERALEMYQFK